MKTVKGISNAKFKPCKIVSSKPPITVIVSSAILGIFIGLIFSHSHIGETNLILLAIFFMVPSIITLAFKLMS